MLSPDGTKLVYGTRVDNQTGLRIRDLATGEERWLKLPVQRDEQESRYTRDLIPGYAFTPDGKSVLAAYGGKIHRLDVQTGADQVIPFSARVSQPVGSRLNFPIRVDDGPVQARLIQAPEPSPDGKHLAFSALTQLYVMDLPDGKPRQLSAGESREFHPSWSPDGKSLAYVSWAPEGGHIWKRPGDGQGEPDAARRGPPRSTSDPVWSPDGKRIVALRAPRRERVENPFDFGPTPGSTWSGFRPKGGDATLDQPRSRRQPAALRQGRRPDLRDDARRAWSRCDSTAPTAARISPSPARRLFARRAGARRGDRAPPRRPMGAGARHQPALPAGPARSSAARRPRSRSTSRPLPLKKLTDIGADYAAWADGGKTITWAVGVELFPPAVRFDRLRSAQERRRRQGRGQGQGRGREEGARSPSPRKSPSSIERPRHRPRGIGRPPRRQGHHDARRRGHRRTATSSSPTTASWPSGPRARSRSPRGPRSSTWPGRPSCPDSSTPTPTGPRSAAACSTCRTGASSPTSPTA